MSNIKDNIREMVMALMRDDKESARAASSKVMSAKLSQRVTESDTGSDSGVMKGSHDSNDEDVTAAKGSVKQASGIDHKEYSGDKPNVYKKKDAVDPKPVNEDTEEVDSDEEETE